MGGKAPAGPRGVQAEPVHDEGHVGPSARSPGEGARGRGRKAGERPDDAKRTGPELPAGGPEVDHEIAVDLPEPHHGRRRERVEDHLGGQPRLHAGGARQHLRPGPWRDDHVGEGAQRRRWCARDDDGPRAAPPPLSEGGQRERRHAARADPAHHVPRAHAEPPERPARVGAPVLGALDGSPERPAAAGDHAHDLPGGHAEGRRALRGVEDPEPPARSGARVHESPARPERVGHQVDGPRERPLDARDAGRRAAVLPGDGGDEALRGEPVERAETRIRPLGREGGVVRRSAGNRAATGRRHGGSPCSPRRARCQGCFTPFRRVDLTSPGGPSRNAYRQERSRRGAKTDGSTR